MRGLHPKGERKPVKSHMACFLIDVRIVPKVDKIHSGIDVKLKVRMPGGRKRAETAASGFLRRESAKTRRFGDHKSRSGP